MHVGINQRRQSLRAFQYRIKAQAQLARHRQVRSCAGSGDDLINAGNPRTATGFRFGVYTFKDLQGMK